MRSPVHSVTDNIVWSQYGAPWAVWRIAPFVRTHATGEQIEETIESLRSCFAHLRKPAVAYGIAEPVAGPPSWAESGYADMTDVTYQRSYWFAAELDDRQTRAGRITAPFRAMLRDIGAPSLLPGDDVVRAIKATTDLSVDLFGDLPNVRAASTAETLWLYHHLLNRGGKDMPVDGFGALLVKTREHKTHAWQECGPASLTMIHDRSVKSLHQGRGRKPVRALLVDDGVQASMTMHAGPELWHVRPGQSSQGEVLANVDAGASFGFPVDWFVRIVPVAHEESMKQLRSQKRKMVEQFDQHGGDMAGVPASVTAAIHGIADEADDLGVRSEPRLLCLVGLAVYGPDVETANDRAGRLESLMDRDGIGMQRPRAAQVALLRAQQPGAPTPRVWSDFRQSLTPLSLAGMGPFCGSVVGDPDGEAWAVNLDTGLHEPVNLDFDYGIRQDTDEDTSGTASAVIVGGLGAGKSYLAKEIAKIVVRKGGQFSTVDRTDSQEWARFAKALDSDAQIVTLNSGLSIDPMICLPPEQAEQAASGFLAMLIGVGPSSSEGAIIDEAVSSMLRHHPGSRLVDVISTLAWMGGTEDGGANDSVARDVARRLSTFKTKRYAAPVFDATREPASFEANVVVFGVAGLVLPTKDQVSNPILTDQMQPEQAWGRAMAYLLAMESRWVTYRDQTRFGLQIADEAWVWTSSPYGETVLKEAVRDCRKHNSGIILCTQDPGDIPPSTMDLLGMRFVGRLEGEGKDENGREGMALKACRVLGVDPSEAGLIAHLAKGRGVFMFRDTRGRVARIGVLPEQDKALHAAMDTRPGRHHEAEFVLVDGDLVAAS